jgi:hypothetical protein
MYHLLFLLSCLGVSLAHEITLVFECPVKHSMMIYSDLGFMKRAAITPTGSPHQWQCICRVMDDTAMLLFRFPGMPEQSLQMMEGETMYMIPTYEKNAVSSSDAEAERDGMWTRLQRRRSSVKEWMMKKKMKIGVSEVSEERQEVDVEEVEHKGAGVEEVEMKVAVQEEDGVAHFLMSEFLNSPSDQVLAPPQVSEDEEREELDEMQKYILGALVSENAVTEVPVEGPSKENDEDLQFVEIGNAEDKPYLREESEEGDDWVFVQED